MELTDYLLAAKRRWWILVLVPLVALAGVTAFQMVKPPSFTATATVAAPALVGGASSNQYTGSAGPKTFVANFQAVLTSPIIVEKVASDLKIPKSRVSGGLASSELGLSSVIQVTYTGSKKSQVGPVANDAARQTLLYLFQSQVDVAQQPVTAAQQQVDSVNSQLAAFAKASGTPVPDRDYQVLATEIAQLQQTQAQASASNNAIEASNLGPEIAAKQQQLSQLAGVLSTYLNLKDQQAQAVSDLNAANQTYQQAKAQFAAANPDQVVTLGNTAKVGFLAATVGAAGVAVASALAFAIAIVFLLEAVRRRHRSHEVGVAPTGSRGATAAKAPTGRPVTSPPRPAARPVTTPTVSPPPAAARTSSAAPASTPAGTNGGQGQHFVSEPPATNGGGLPHPVPAAPATNGGGLPHPVSDPTAVVLPDDVPVVSSPDALQAGSAAESLGEDQWSQLPQPRG